MAEPVNDTLVPTVGLAGLYVNESDNALVVVNMSEIGASFETALVMEDSPQLASMV